MDFQGEYLTKWIGVGGETDPSLAFQDEDQTGIYLDQPNPSSGSGFAITKRGRKRIRVDDTKTTFYDPVVFNGGTGSAGLSLVDGSSSSPALAFTSHPTTGWWLNTSNPSNPTITQQASTSEFTGDVQVDGTLDLTSNSNKIGLFASGGSQTAPAMGFVNGPIIYGGTDNSLIVSDSVGPTDMFKFSKTDSKNSSFFPFTTGTQPMTCGALSSDSITSTGRFIQNFSGGTLATPQIQMSSVGTGINYDTPSHTMYVSIASSSVAQFSSTSSAVSSPFTCGTNSMTCGPLSCDTINGIATTNLVKYTNYFGDSSDGAVTYSDGATHTLTRDMHFTTLTLTNGSIVFTAGYRIFASVVITGDGTGNINYNGNNASGLVGGVTLANGQAYTSLAGANGGNINLNGNASVTTGGMGSVGGRGSDSTTKTGGAAGTFNLNPYYLFRNFQWAVTGQINIAAGGLGGGGGAGGPTTIGSGGGAGGGTVAIWARSIGNLLSVSANGGNGGVAGVDGGVGGGGGGGVIILFYQSLLGGFNLNTQLIVNGGAVGTGGVNINAAPGTTGRTFVYQLV